MISDALQCSLRTSQCHLLLVVYLTFLVYTNQLYSFSFTSKGCIKVTIKRFVITKLPVESISQDIYNDAWELLCGTEFVLVFRVGL